LIILVFNGGLLKHVLIKVVELMLKVVKSGMKMQIISSASSSTFNRRKTLHIWVSMQYCFEIDVT
jgi:hypothetical protein